MNSEYKEVLPIYTHIDSLTRGLTFVGYNAFNISPPPLYNVQIEGIL